MGYAKWLGGGLGWAFGGPIGGLFGFFVGSFFDSATVVTTTSGTTQRGDFVASLLVLTAAMMKADGKVLKSELDYVKRFLLNQFGENAASQYLQNLKQLLDQEIPVVQVCHQIRDAMPHSERLQLMHYLWGIAMADGHLDESELDLLVVIANNLRISQADFNSIRAMYVKDTGSAYKILEIEKTATDEEVKKAYRKMAVKYHPDKVTHLWEEIKRSAEEKFKKLNEAYESIKKERGMV